MTVHVLAPAGELDIPALPRAAQAEAGGGAAAFGGALGSALGGAYTDASSALERAAAAEQRFTVGKGGMQEMVLERAQADIALSLASAAASRAAQALTTILGMQI